MAERDLVLLVCHGVQFGCGGREPTTPSVAGGGGLRLELAGRFGSCRRAHGCPRVAEMRIARGASSHAYLLVHGAPASPTVSEGGGLRLEREDEHLRVLRWLWEKGCPWDDSACIISAARGRTHPRRRVADGRGCQKGADLRSCRSLQCLQWLRGRAAPGPPRARRWLIVALRPSSV